MSIEKAYDSWSEIYDTNKNRTRDLDKKVTIETLKGYEFDTILELGCGTGKNTAWFSKKAKNVLAFDLSEGMLKKAREKIAAKNVVFQKADFLEPWPIQNAAGDLISFNLVLEHIEDLNSIFKQAYSKLKPGGMLFVCELHPFKQYAGTKARFEKENEFEALEVFLHHTTDYTEAAKQEGFKLLEIKEWFDEEEQKELPRLISFVFKK